MHPPINILVDNLGPNQLAYEIITQLNELGPTSPFMVFYQNFCPYIIYPRFSCMHITEAWAQKGTTIATNLSTAMKLQDFVGPNHRFYYVYDTEWLRGKHRPYELFQKVYCDKSYKLIAKSENHALALANGFNNPPVFVMPRFSVKDIMEKCAI